MKPTKPYKPSGMDMGMGGDMGMGMGGDMMGMDMDSDYYYRRG